MKKRCTFEKHGGYPCNLEWPASKATPSTPQWEAIIRRDMCVPCGETVRRKALENRQEKKEATPGKAPR
jgi:hypothetical protein